MPVKGSVLKKRIWLAALAAFILLFTAGCADKPEAVATDEMNTESAAPSPTQTASIAVGVDGVSEATIARYQENEIREYQGMRLDPSIGPRDNSISGVQHVDIDSYTLTITGLVEDEISLSYAEVLEFTPTEKLITLHCVEGWEATILWKGVRIMDILDAAGYDGDAVTVIFKSVDGYTTSMPLSTIKARDLILAYGANDITLPDEMGYPFIVVAEDKLGYKWARWVNEIEVSADADYKGFWESNGFGNEAEVTEGIKY